MIQRPDCLGLAAAGRMGPLARRPAIDVEMHPARRLRDEALQEQSRGDGAGHAAGRRIGDIGKFGADILVVAHIERHPPQRVIRLQARLGQIAGKFAVVREEGRQVGAERDAGSTRQRRHVDHQVRCVFIGIGQRIGEDQPSLGIRIVDLHGQALAASVDIAGAEGVGRNRILDDRNDDAQVDLELGVHNHQRQAHDVGSTAHVLLHQQHRGCRLDIEAAGIEADALAH